MQRSRSTANEITLRYKAIVIISLFMLLFLAILLNYINLKKFQDIGIHSFVSLNNLLFLLIGMLLFAISAYLSICMSYYKVGKLFAVYAFLSGLSVSLAPCSQLHPAVDIAETISALAGSLILFQTIGQLTLLNRKMLFYLFRGLLAICTVLGTVSRLLQPVIPTPHWIALLSEECVNTGILICASGSLIIMGVHYRTGNPYSKKQMKILIAGVICGVILFLTSYFMPFLSLMYMGSLSNTPVTVEIVLQPDSALLLSFPLLLFTCVSVAILFTLFIRGFIPAEGRLKLWHFIFTACYLFSVNTVFFIYNVFPALLLLLLNMLLSIPVFLLFGKGLKMPGSDESTEEIFRWKMLEELEQERQQLSAYLHDEVLQSLIAFYRHLQADSTQKYSEAKEYLPKMIAQIRRISQNLYPTVVEDLGLEQSLILLANDLKNSYPGIEIVSEYRLAEGILPEHLAVPFYRIIRELATNAAKHSNGTQINISLSEDRNGYYIRVRDNGQGFVLPQTNALLQLPHMGIYTVKKQISKLHGQISIRSEKGFGTEYYIYIPAKEGQQDANKNKDYCCG